MNGSVSFQSLSAMLPKVWREIDDFHSELPHIHQVDRPYRLTSSWQDADCKLGMWYQGSDLVAWAAFLPAWWNLDFGIAPHLRGSELERDIFSWGIDQMQAYATRVSDDFYGSVELYEDTPHLDKTAAHLDALGFKKFEWSTLRFEKLLDDSLPAAPELPAGFAIRPLAGESEIDQYVAAQRAAFGSNNMTGAWRARTLQYPTYRPELDLVAVDPNGKVAGFAVCWISDGVGQIEPLGVHPDFQGLGLGRALELSAFHILHQHGARTICIDHTSFNEKAISLSLKNGFRQVNNALRYYVEIEP